jgi:hypothetical protein
MPMRARASRWAWAAAFAIAIGIVSAGCSGTPMEGPETPTAIPDPTGTPGITTTPSPTPPPTPGLTVTPTRAPVPTNTPLPTGIATPTPSAEATAVIAGRVNIGPLCPVEPCPPNTPNPYTGRSLILEPAHGGDPVMVPLQDDGVFRAIVPAGDYEVRLLNCDFLGCPQALPRNLTIAPDQQTRLDIEIDTGIR